MKDFFARTLIAGLASLSSLTYGDLASAQSITSGITPEVAQQIDIISNEKSLRSAAQQKMHSALIYSARLAKGQPQFPNAPALLLPQLSAKDKLDANGRILIDIKTGDATGTANDIVSRGGTIISALPDYNAVRASVPAAMIEDIAALSAVTSIRPADLGMSNRIDPPPSVQTRINNVRSQVAGALGNGASQGNAGKGTTVSEGVVAHGADILQKNSGIDGAGVKVCVISDGVNSLTQAQSAGELPAVDVLSGQAGNGDEGTAMLEIVADMAPGATLGFATATGGKAQMAANIAGLQGRGCNIIVDDWTYFAEAAYQEDVIANAVTTFVQAGGIYFSSAANSGRYDGNHSGTWEGDYVNGGTTNGPLYIANVHMFGSLPYDTLTTAAGDISLQWSDPIGHAANDYDIYVVDSTGSSILASSTNTQIGYQDPYEEIVCNNCSYPSGSRIYVRKYSGDARALRVDTHRARLSNGTTGSTFGHNGGINTVSVAAVSAHNLQAQFDSTFQTETYSSDGPRQLFIQPVPSTTPYTANCYLFSCGGYTVSKPEISAADCVATTLSNFNPFCGTSAAAPHAASIAALIKSREQTWNRGQVLGRMEATAIDIMATGADRDSGYGIAMADRAALGLAGAPRDFNHDSKADILWRDSAGNLSQWLMNGGSASFVNSLGNVGTNWTIVGQRDFNGDGNTDILWMNSGGGLAIWFMNGSSVANVVSLGSIATNWSVVGTGDYNGDGKGDILWRNTAGDVVIWFMNGASVSSVAGFGNVAPNWFVAGSADFDGDGITDILWRNSSGSTFAWFMNGANVSAVSNLGYVATNWSVVGTYSYRVSPIAGNSQSAGILWRNTTGDTVRWIMIGAASLQVVSLGNVPANWSVVGKGDYNGDVKDDILWRDTSGNTAMWLMNGTKATSVISLGTVATTWTVQNSNAD